VTTFLWAAIGFLIGALPFSYWLGRLVLNTDIRRYGDGNPGAINAWRAGGWRLGVPASLLDYLKGAIPVGLANSMTTVSGWGLVGVAVAPVLGHSFSPFLGFRGGKAMAATFGIWTGLTLWEGPTILGTLIAIFFCLQRSDTWAVILGMLAFFVYLALQLDNITLMICGANMLIITWKHRHGLRQIPWLRPWILNLSKGLR